MIELFVLGAALAAASGGQATITIDDPAEGSVFPADFAAPLFVWQDSSRSNKWRVEISFGDGMPAIEADSAGARLGIGEIDPRCIADTNSTPRLSARESSARSWRPDAAVWAAIKQRSTERPATVTITGFQGRRATSRGQVSIRTSRDPVGAPIFYRDVPLMPSEVEKGVIKPLVPAAIPLVAWRLKYVSEPRSRLLLEGLHTCANCHSFSRDGKILGMDLDGPQNDRGAYVVAPVAERMVIRDEHVMSWNDFPGQAPERNTIGFLSQVSPDGRYVVSTVSEALYVANYKDYRFLQVFYPTRGILAWYSPATGRMAALPGADDPRYVQTNAAWSPEGEYLVFARAPAADPYPAGRKAAAYANDPNEIPMRFDLYRVPFNGGQGGTPEPVLGASANGRSNSFPKISPDGKWIVFVQARNGLLMRPDSQLYIVPAAGGRPRRMRCNTPLMNSWHSFSPNGRWLVFSSKSRSPYTRMFLTHIDENGEDSPAIPIENATAANRAVNIPEFINLAPGGLLGIQVPAAAFLQSIDHAWELAEKEQYEASAAEWKRLLALRPDDAKLHNSYGTILSRMRRFEDATAEFRAALALNPQYPEAHNNLAVALMQEGKSDEAVFHYELAIRYNPAYAQAHYNLGRAFAGKGKFEQAIQHWRRAVEIAPEVAAFRHNLAVLLAERRAFDEAIAHWRKALELDPDLAQAHFGLGDALYLRGDIENALGHWRSGLRSEPGEMSVLVRAARVLATHPQPAIRNGAEAVALAERSVSIARNAATLDVLAMAYAEAGRFSEAVDAALQAVGLAEAQGNRELAISLRARLALYRNGSPFRVGPPLP